MSGAVLDALLRASLHGALFVAAVWAVCRLLPDLPASVRCGLWWLACLKIVLGLASPVELAWLPADPVVAAVAPSPPDQVDPVPPLPSPLPRTGGEGASTFLLLRQFPRPQDFLLGLWLASLLAQLGLTARQLGRARGLVRRSRPVGEPWIAERFEELRRELSLGDRARLRLSDEVEAPQVLGLMRPVVLLPASRSLSRPDLSMALCHELVHVRRADLWWGWGPALAQRVFWFHPLARLAAREYALAREAACDAEVLRVLDPEPQAYGRLLLRLGIAPRTTTLAAAGAAPSVQTLKRRLQMLEQSSENRRLPLGWVGLIVLVAALAAVPFRMVAQEAPPAPPAPAEPGTPAPPAEPGTPVAAAEPGMPAPPAEPVPPAPRADAPRAVPAPPATPAMPAVAPQPAPPAPPAVPAVAPVARVAHAGAVPPKPPVPPTPPTPPTPPRPVSLPKGETYVLLLGDDHTVMSGSMSDIRKAKELQKGGEPLLYFRRNGKAYVVRDAATVKAAQELFRPQMELGEKQGALGGQQGELGGRQGELGAKQAELGAQQASLAAKRVRLDDDKAADELDREMEALNDKQEELGRKQEELGRQQEALGRKQEELGRQQEKLGREAEVRFRGLVDEALKSGKAQVVG
ncbi:MAG: M56 family metallopeptidase [Acidobacteriota bacterium]